MIVGQFIFILCIYLKMAPKIKTLNEGSLIKFKKTSHEEAVPGGTSTNVQMISIKSTESDEFSNSSNSTIDKVSHFSVLSFSTRGGHRYYIKNMPGSLYENVHYTDMN